MGIKKKLYAMRLVRLWHREVVETKHSISGWRGL